MPCIPNDGTLTTCWSDEVMVYAFECILKFFDRWMRIHACIDFVAIELYKFVITKRHYLY